MSSGNKWCVNCKYENVDKRISHDDPQNPEPYEGYAIWCDKQHRFIGSYAQQGLKKLPDGTVVENECPYFEHY